MTQESQSSTEAAPQDAHSGSTEPMPQDVRAGGTEPMPQDVRAAQELLDFIGECPSMFHTTSTIGKRLTTAGFTYLPETQPWNIEQGGTYYTTRNNSSVITFKVGTSLDNYHFQITASHGVSPTFKVKSNAELTGPGESQRLNVEVYGGAVDYTWFDRPLGIAGRVMVKNGNRVESRLYESAEPLALIPSMPPHIQRDINQQFSPNRQVDLCPLFSAGALGKSTFDAIIADELGISESDIVARDLFLVNRQQPCIWGAAGEFASSPKFDDLACAYTALEAFLAADNDIPKTALQVNPLKAAPEQVAAALDEAGVAYEPHPWLHGCFLVSGTGNLEALPLFRSGAVCVQDAAAKLAVLASGAAPGMRVLDCCAAPGGKSFAAAMQMENTGSILSCDLHAHKISLIEKNAARLGISIIEAEQRSAAEVEPALEKQFDLVIADVPCSGLGVIRKKPDIRYKPLDAIERLPDVQRAILETVSRYVKPGGALLYSTCTVRKEENEAVVLPFLQAHPEFSLEPFPVPDGLDLPNEGYATLLPHKHAADGFFICKLRKHA